MSWQCEFERFYPLPGFAVVEQCVGECFQQVPAGYQVVIVGVLREMLCLCWQVVMHCLSANNLK